MKKVLLKHPDGDIIVEVKSDKVCFFEYGEYRELFVLSPSKTKDGLPVFEKSYETAIDLYKKVKA